MDIKPGDYICYTNKKELGKVKRIAGSVSVFAWFHTGDTASCISSNNFTLVLTDKLAKEMGEKKVVEYLRLENFSNDYAIEEIVRKS